MYERLGDKEQMDYFSYQKYVFLPYTMENCLLTGVIYIVEFIFKNKDKMSRWQRRQKDRQTITHVDLQTY